MFVETNYKKKRGKRGEKERKKRGGEEEGKGEGKRRRFQGRDPSKLDAPRLETQLCPSSHFGKNKPLLPSPCTFPNNHAGIRLESEGNFISESPDSEFSITIVDTVSDNTVDLTQIQQSANSKFLEAFKSLNLDDLASPEGKFLRRHLSESYTEGSKRRIIDESLFSANIFNLVNKSKASSNSFSFGQTCSED